MTEALRGTLRTGVLDERRRREAGTALSGLAIGLALLFRHLWTMPGIAGGLFLGAAAVAGTEIAVRALRDLRRGHFGIELLVTIAVVGALFLGSYWEAAAVSFLFQAGAYLEGRSMRQTRSALRSLLEQAPQEALRLREAGTERVPIRTVERGDRVLVRPGASVPVDGRIEEGRSAIDESPITGEPMPVEKGEGDEVYAGTTNQSGLLTVRVDRSGGETTLARIVRRVEEAQEDTVPAQRWIDRFARWYTPAIVLGSVLTGVLTGDLRLALTLLVISCPGALVIAVPVSTVSGIGKGARSGILIRGGANLERTGSIDVMAVDKTGTLTQGRPTVTEVVSAGAMASAGVSGPAGDRERRARLDAGPAGSEGMPEELLLLAAAAEAGSDHPIASAIRSAVSEEDRRDGAPAEFEEFRGRGVRARVDGKEVAVGSVSWIRERTSSNLAGHLEEEIRRLRASARTVVAVAVDGTARGIIGISDPLRPEARDLRGRLREVGVDRVLVITGDESPVAEAVAREAGLEEVHAGQLPEEKATIVRRLQEEGRTVGMVGDGINDAPALAAADVGIAMGATGKDLVIDTADLALTADRLERLPEAIELSRSTMRNVRQNVVIAVGTVALLVAGVLAGEVNMAGGMFVHEASVLAVILNGLRAGW